MRNKNLCFSALVFSATLAVCEKSAINACARAQTASAALSSLRTRASNSSF